MPRKASTPFDAQLIDRCLHAPIDEIAALLRTATLIVSARSQVVAVTPRRPGRPTATAPGPVAVPVVPTQPVAIDTPRAGTVAQARTRADQQIGLAGRPAAPRRPRGPRPAAARPPVVDAGIAADDAIVPADLPPQRAEE